MLTPLEIDKAAVELHTAEESVTQVRALSQRFKDMDMDDAYKVQQRWVDSKIGAGRSVIGYKIGLTSRAMQQAMSIDTPDYGVLLDDMLFENGSTVCAGKFPDPRIEVEFAFVMKEPLFGDEISIQDVLNATDYVVPSLELIAARSFRIDPETGYKRTVMDTIADNAANAGVILGEHRIDPLETDLRHEGAILLLNGEVEETGLGAGVLNHPAHGIRWVCKRFAKHGVGLEPGQVVLSGSFTRPVPAAAGDHFYADFGSLGSVELTFG